MQNSMALKNERRNWGNLKTDVSEDSWTRNGDFMAGTTRPREWICNMPNGKNVPIPLANVDVMRPTGIDNMSEQRQAE